VQHGCPESETAMQAAGSNVVRSELYRQGHTRCHHIKNLPYPFTRFVARQCTQMQDVVWTQVMRWFILSTVAAKISRTAPTTSCSNTYL
jgi:hypothetical protein